MENILVFIGGVGVQELLVIGLFVLLFFGARKIPEFMRSMGKGIKEFKDGVREVRSDIETSSPDSKS